MADSELRVLKLHAPLYYAETPARPEPGFPFPGHSVPSDGDEELALYDPESAIRLDPEDGPRSAEALPSASVTAVGAKAPGTGAGPSLDRGSYGFMQGIASDEGELLGLLEEFARQAWWERLECEGPYIIRRVFEDGRWAAQVWRRLARD